MKNQPMTPTKLPPPAPERAITIRLKSVDFHTNITINNVFHKGIVSADFQDIQLHDNYVSFRDERNQYVVPLANVLVAVKL